MTARTVMIQGTASHAGKSVLVAALCRIFRQDGYRVAPFKSQNMALNAAVTIDGGEIGRSQATQARAAGIAPTVDMNPILLKPEAEMRSQVVVRGRVWATLAARDYHQRRAELLGVIAASLARLRAEYDIVAIEGAGSPAEINLRAHEIVNMRVAKLAGAPVFLAGDIDRGGVFAALLGTLELLEPEERQRVKGLIVNKFRGDIELLKPGLETVATRTGVPFVGVVPHLPDLAFPAEDSVSLEDARDAGAGEAVLDIAVVKLPRIANFDDFDPLAAEPGVVVRFVATPGELGAPDLIVIPGTKSTIADLAAIRDSGLAAVVIQRAATGTPVLGICGGYQLLGTEIVDEEGVESATRSAPGLGLLPVRTCFGARKRTEQASATVAANHGLFAGLAGLPVEGYEIHMGETAGPLPPALGVTARQGRPVSAPDGAVSADGLVAGVYLHGLFTAPAFRTAFLRNLAARKGVAPLDWGRAAREDPFDRLAAHVRAHLDLEAIYGAMGLAR